MPIVFVLTPYMRVRHKVEGIEDVEGIEGNRPLRVGKIRRNLARIALAKFLPTLLSRV